MTQIHFENLIVVTPGIRSGKPCIAGTRITVYDILEYLASGMTIEELVKEFTSITREDVLEAIAFG